MHAKIINQQVEKYPYSIGELRKEHPNTSFPKKPNDALLSTFNVERVFDTPHPEVSDTQTCSERTPVFNSEAQQWERVWEVRDLTEDEQNARDTEVAASVRTERNKLLSESDWTQLADSSADATAWATYRQALRNITAQSGFPHSVTWPVAPE